MFDPLGVLASIFHETREDSLEERLRLRGEVSDVVAS